MSHIYTITSIPFLPYNQPSQFPRCFGYFNFLFQAVKAVKENRCNIQESYYEYVVIEKIGTGIHAMAEDKMWFRWVTGSSPHWEQCERPQGEQFDGIVNFNGIG